MARIISPSGHFVEFGAAVTGFGTAPGNDVQVPEAYGFAPTQFQIKQSGEKEILVDQQSGNPTIVNGNQVSTHELNSGDIIQAGGLSLRYEPGGPLPPAALKKAARKQSEGLGGLTLGLCGFLCLLAGGVLMWVFGKNLTF